MKSVLVTGGAGFIGSHVCEALRRQNINVTVLDVFADNYEPAIKRANAKVLEQIGVRVVEGDILDKPLVLKCLQDSKADIVLHLAARPGVRQSLDNPELFMKVNMEGTASVLEACRAAGISKVVFASSSSVYGNNSRIPFTEADAPDFPVSPYAASKRSGELLCYSYHTVYNMSFYCLRFFTVYGPRQRTDMAIHKFTKLIETGQPVPMFGEGETERDYTFISDIVQGVVRSLERCSGFQVINLGESQTITLKNLIAAIGKALGKEPKIQKMPMQPGDVLRTCADISLAKKLLDYRPTTDIHTGLAEFVKWFRSKDKIV